MDEKLTLQQAYNCVFGHNSSCDDCPLAAQAMYQCYYSAKSIIEEAVLKVIEEERKGE